MPKSLARMTARSVVLSVLLGAHPAWASAAELIRLTNDFGIKETTLRVALTRMVSSGDLVRSADGYRLSDRLLARQRRQDDAMRPQLRAWHGSWTTLIVTSVGTEPGPVRRCERRCTTSVSGNCARGCGCGRTTSNSTWTRELRARVRIVQARDDAPDELAGQLWDLPSWARTGHRLLAEMSDATDVPARFVVAAAIVRHLLTDPVLPAELLPADWPGARLRAAYNDFAAELIERRDGIRLVEAT